MKYLPKTARGVASVFLLIGMSAAHAYEQPITARFTADSSKPHENKFTNTTPVSGYCAEYPSWCGTSIFSIRVPISFNSTGPIQANHADYRQGAMFNVPVNWRTAQVRHSVTGETENVEVRFIGVGTRYRLYRQVTDLVGGESSILAAHAKLWGGTTWTYPSGPCQTQSTNAAYSGTHFGVFWRTPSAGVCTKQTRYLIPQFKYEFLDFAYELRTPNPLGMSSGLYTGSLVYGMGPRRDIDMGDVMVPWDSVLNFNFRLTVQHALKVDIPPGGNRVELAPQDGWQAWLSRGRAPTRLFRDQTFRISSSARFKMNLECQYTIGNTCAIWDGSGHSAPVDVSVSLPHGLTDDSGRAVKRRPLLRDGSGTTLFRPGFYVDYKPGTLHFEISQANAAQMVAEGDGTYSGNVTVVWDSDI
jgi:hypothetical protein